MAPQSTGRQLGTERQMGLTQEVFGRENVVAETGTGRCGDLEVPSWGQGSPGGGCRAWPSGPPAQRWHRSRHPRPLERGCVCVSSRVGGCRCVSLSVLIHVSEAGLMSVPTWLTHCF